MGQWLAGERPQVGIEGDSALATDVSWLIDNLRWDIEDDIARVIGQAPAHELARAAAVVSAGFRDAVRALQGLMARGPQ
jgi:ubiquinone biosynthesis protein UbiJ